MVRDAVPLGECRRALVIKLRHHGDVLLASPVLSLLKSRGIDVDALVYDDTAPMLEGHPALSMLHKVGRRWKDEGPASRFFSEKRLFQNLRARSFDLVVHLSEQPRGAWLARALGARYSVAPRMAGRGAFWEKSFTHLYPAVPRRHQVEVNLDALRRIGLYPTPQDKRVLFVPGADAERKVEVLVGNEPFVHAHPASRWRFKCWPAEKNAELIDRLAAEGHRVVITAAPDPEELQLVKSIVEKARSAPINLAGQLSIKELGAVAARASLFVGVDSMPMHLAAAMGVPTVALFGPSGELEWGPWSSAFRVVSTTHSCRPCGQDGCGGSKVSECLTMLPVDAVHAAAQELLGPLTRGQ
jgi:heptosyltransferase III